jgi:hypothetical protein
MPLQNRVNPFGELVATAARGTLTGNRGIIHNEERTIARPYQLKAWITCTLVYKNFRREVMTGRKWTELFFLDEVTAFAAGHRPCAFCRNADYKRFKQSWLSAFPAHHLMVKDIDAKMHSDRLTVGKRKKTFQTSFSDVVSGTMFCLTQGKEVFLFFNGRVAQWSFEGYTKASIPSPEKMVEVLTPACTIACFKQGYEPTVHESFMDCF